MQPVYSVPPVPTYFGHAVLVLRHTFTTGATTPMPCTMEAGPICHVFTHLLGPTAIHSLAVFLRVSATTKLIRIESVLSFCVIDGGGSLGKDILSPLEQTR
eukprot:scaffold304_cov409-Prasinococcus_capsulatus_cf.AAC.11